jgi:diguanylate cyclase (GGDEF)-like protein/PAS domain S-box-containing protein
VTSDAYPSLKLRELLRAFSLLLSGAGIEEALGCLGEAAGADRVYVFAVHPHPETGEIAASQLWEWCREGVEPQLDNPELQNLPVERAGFGRWVSELGAGKLVFGAVRSFPESERPLLESQGIRSILVAPIFRRGEIWGFVGFDAVREERVWQEQEREVLQAAAAAFGDQLERDEAWEELQEAEKRWREFLAHIPDAVVVHDGTEVLYANAAAHELFGLPPGATLVGREGKTLVHQGSWGLVRQRVAAMLERGEPAPTLELTYTRFDGSSFLAETRSMPMKLGRRRVIVSVLRDLGERKRWMEQIQHLAYHDGLTDLPNRRLLRERAEHLLALAKRHKFPVALGYLDLDRFKEVNDTLGHDAGDELLQAVALRLGRAARETDIVARLGGDEFALLWPQTGHEGARVAARRILECFAQPFALREELLSIEASLGIAVFPGDGESLEELMRAADVAMYRAKAARSGFAFYAPELDRYSRGRLAFLERVKRALREQRIAFFFQPILAATSRQVRFAEALARLGEGEEVLAAGRFVPLLQEVGLASELDRLALRAGARAVKALGLPVTVNVAGPSLASESFVAFLEEVFAEHGLAPGELWLEVTEAFLVEGTEDALATLRRVRAMGVPVVLDDFGSGYSSLALLRDVTSDLVKLDAAFVRAAMRDARGRALLEGVVELAHRLGVQVVAEGVESLEESQALAALGCDFLQGFCFAPAIPSEDPRWRELAPARDQQDN